MYPPARKAPFLRAHNKHTPRGHFVRELVFEVRLGQTQVSTYWEHKVVKHICRMIQDWSVTVLEKLGYSMRSMLIIPFQDFQIRLQNQCLLNPRRQIFAPIWLFFLHVYPTDWKEKLNPRNVLSSEQNISTYCGFASASSSIVTRLGLGSRSG